MDLFSKTVGLLFLLLCCGICKAFGRSEAGIVETRMNTDNRKYRDQRPLLADTKIFVKMECKATVEMKLEIFWTLIERECWFVEPPYNNYVSQMAQNPSLVIQNSSITEACNVESHIIVIPGVQAPVAAALSQTNASSPPVAEKLTQNQHPMSPTRNPITIIPHDGIYEWTLVIVAKDGEFSAPLRIEYLGPHGYISATDWPLLPFYGIMCMVYLIYGIIWLVVSFMQWRDLLRIQFWIGGVILLGMLEKAFFYAQYHSLNTRGIPVEQAELAAEFVSCAKRTLARMLVIIMSLGFGIVKPRLGPMLHRVVGVGTLYFVLACVESYLRITHTKPEQRNELLVASIPLAVLDTGICWWILTSLVQTMRTLRLRRNMVKLSLYRHFTNTLIFSVIASVIFMLFAMRLRKTENCTPGWHNIWIDTAFWHILFSVLLLVIMILWRPTNNNQRYAFTPLLDNPEDEDDEEEDQFVADAYGVKMRGTNTTANGGAKTTPTSSQRGTTTEDDDLRWVEEHIPSSIAEPTLPVLDSDEEIINTKFEVSKMQ